LIYPDNLEKGTIIGVTATSAGLADPIDWIRMDNGISHFAKLGYPVTETDHVRKDEKGRSCDGRTRAVELMELFADSRVRVIVTATGGEYLMEMLSYVDFAVLADNPTWLQGYSDTTGIAFTVTTNLDMATIYGCNFGSFGMEPWNPSLIDNISILEGKDVRQHSFDRYQDGFVKKITGLEPYVLEKEVMWKNVFPSNAVKADEIFLHGRALGGCLDVLLNLVGTRFDKTVEFIEKYKEDGILWILESFDLSSEALTRGLWQLKEAGWFTHAVGFVFGRPAMFQSFSNTSYEEAVVSVLGELHLPIILEADIGHKPPQLTMINGAIATIRSKGGKGEVSFERR
jgi:muramoyltetrapeptide carboxypeptidase